MKRIKKTHVLEKDSLSKQFCIISLVFLMFCGTVIMAFGQATYADLWLDNTNEGFFVYGRGASEINYVDEDGVEVVVTVTGPDGRTISTGAFGEISVQADTRLSSDFEEFGDFFIKVERFPMCIDGTGAGYGDDGILLRHGYNGTSGTIWWRPTGYIRCPRPSTIVSLSIMKVLHAYRLDLPSGDYIPTCCSPCTIYPRYGRFLANTPYTQCTSIYLYNREIPCSIGLCDTPRYVPGRCRPDTGREPPFC